MTTQMVKKLYKSLGLLALGLLALGPLAPASQAAGLMTLDGSPESALKIQSHQVAVTIEDGYAITVVEQAFSNEQTQDLEAVYHFPVPDQAAVAEFTVWIDGQPVIAEVLEKAQAEQVYQQEKDAGRVAGITSKNRHYNFEIKVSPVRAQQDTRIRLVYMQPIDLDTGIGRYVYPLEDGGTDDQARAFWTTDSTVQQSFSFDLNLRSGYPLSGIRLPAHPQASIVQKNKQQWTVSLSQSASQAVDEEQLLQPPLPGENGSTAVATLNQDIVVYWRLADGLPGAVDLLTHKTPGAEHGTFMLSLTPGDDLARITQGRDWVFVLDMSGSMEGKYHTLTEGVQRALKKLSGEDRFRIMRFNRAASELTNGWVNSTPANISYWSGELAATEAGGGTNLYAGISKGLRALDSERTSAIVLVTDGEANVGVTEKQKFLQLMEKYDVRLFTAVMGNGANRPLLEAMTAVSNGFAVSVSNNDDIVGKLIEFTSKATHQAMHDVELVIKGVKTTDLTPSVSTTLYRGQQLVVLGHYRGGGEASVTLKAKVSGQPKEYKTRFNLPLSDTANPELERLWAYAKIRELQQKIDYLGEDSEYSSAITSLASSYGLVTDYTSMVVMRDEQFEARGIERHNRDRRQNEMQAASKRSASATVSRRVDSAQPAFTQPRASHQGTGSGGGAFGFELLLLLSFTAWTAIRHKLRRSC